jgi:hypothetical protein
MDRQEDEYYGESARGDELPNGLEKTEQRITKIEELLDRRGMRSMLL